MRRSDVERKLLDEPGRAGGLSLGQVQHEAGHRARADDAVSDRALKASADEPRIERVVAVLDEHRAVRETQEGSSGIAKLGRADQHGAVDVVAPVRVWVDRGLAVHQRVEEGERSLEREALRPDLEDQEWSVAGALDVQGDELRVIQARQRAEPRRVDGNLLPQNRLDRSARFEVNGLYPHEIRGYAVISRGLL